MNTYKFHSEGRRAARVNAPRSSCPYKSLDRATAWLAGYDAMVRELAEHCAEQEKPKT